MDTQLHIELYEIINKMGGLSWSSELVEDEDENGPSESFIIRYKRDGKTFCKSSDKFWEIANLKAASKALLLLSKMED